MDLEYAARLVRRHIVQMVYEARSGHLGGSLSAADILTALYFDVMDVDPQRPDWSDRDRFILSKGHAAPALYAVLALKGYFPLEELGTLRKFKSRLQGHPDMTKTPGVDFTSGSLGNGLGLANGLGIAARLMGKSFHVFVLLGDGELQEGTVWESALTTSTRGLSNVTAIIDLNKLQVEGEVTDIKQLYPLEEKWQSFGWDTVFIDGHNIELVASTLRKAKGRRGKPLAVIANTVKGKGVSFMEGELGWHKGELTEELYRKALAEIG